MRSSMYRMRDGQEGGREETSRLRDGIDCTVMSPE